MPVTSTHAKFDWYAPLWETVDDCASGEPKVKKRTTKYLPVPNPQENDASSERYKQYLKRALFLNVTGRTLNSLVGAAFRKDPVVELPPQIEYILDDADNSNNSLVQLARSCVSSVLLTGRHGLLVDYPSAPAGLSREEVARLGLRPVITEYAAQTIINWREESGMLSLVVLLEEVETTSDGFKYTTERQYRVLRMEEGRYWQYLYNEAGELISEPVMPTKADGSAWDVIPFIIVGSVNNSPDVDPIPLYDIAAVNLAHYRASADYEEGVFIHGQPMLHIDVGTMSAEEWKALNPNGIQVGARRGIQTQGGGSANLMQAAANTAAFESMSHKEAQMLKLGARLITEGGQNETAEAVRANNAAETSVLETVVRNVGEALELCLRWVSEFAGADPEAVSVSMNTDFFDKAPDPNMIAQMMGLESIGIISSDVILAYLRKTGVVDDTLSDEDIMGQVESRPV